MRNQIREKEDGTFEVGIWIINADKKVVFMEFDEAETIQQAMELVDTYDEMDFKQAKFEIDRLGGMDAANNILAELKRTNTIAVLFEKDHFDINKLKYLDQKSFEEYMDFTSNNGGVSNQDFVGEWDLISNLKTLRFLTY